MSQKFRIIFIILNLYISTYKSIIRYIIFSKPSTSTPQILSSSIPQILSSSVPYLITETLSVVIPFSVAMRSI